MKIVPKLERQIAHLQQEDFKKLFPQQYYSKYAAHHNIIKFEDQVYRQTKGHDKILLKINSEKQLTSSNKKTKMTRFDPPEDVILKNKQQTKRMQQFVKELNHKIKEGPHKTNQNIRTPLNGFVDLQQGVFNRLKLLQDAQYEAELQYIRQKKRKDREYMNFVQRSKFNSITISKLPRSKQKSLAADSVESRSINEYHTMSNTMIFNPGPADFYLASNCDPNRSISFAQKAQQIITNTRSQIVNLNPENKNTSLKCILAMNRSIRKMNSIQGQLTSQKRRFHQLSLSKQLKTISSGVEHISKKEKNDLVTNTLKIRNQVKSLEPMSRYKQAMSQRDLRLRIQLMK